MKPALLVIDMQNDFLKDASPYQAGMLDTELVKRVKRLVEFSRSKNIPVIYTQHSINADKSNAEAGEPEDVRACITGTKGWEIIEEIKPQKDDLVVRKDKYDAFYGTNLEETIAKLKIDTVIICGVLTNNCVRATAEGAHYRGLKLIIIKDCCGGTSYTKDLTHEQIHEITLNDLKERLYWTELVSPEEFTKRF